MSKRISRRDFLKAGTGVAVAGASKLLLTGCTVQSLPGETLHASPELVEKHERWVPTICFQCPSGCGMKVRVVEGRAVKIEGNPLHPINRRVLCPKGQAALEALYDPDREMVSGPLRRIGPRGSGQWEAISWDEAIQQVAGRLRELRQQGQPHTVVTLYGEVRGQMRQLIERFMAAIGSPNAISRESKSVQAAKTAHYLTQGIYDLLAYDLENTNYLISFGASLLEAGRPTQRFISGISYMRRGRPIRGKLVVVDPRLSVTAGKADEWIPIRPGTDAALALGMANVIIKSGLYDRDFVANQTFGFEDFTDEDGVNHKGFKSLVLEEYHLKQVEEITGVPAATISRLAGEFATNKPSVAVVPCRGGLHNGSNGLYTAMAIHSLNALVGNIDRPGGILVQRYPPCAGWPALPPDPVAEVGRAQERLDGAGSRAYPLARHVYQEVADRILRGEPYPTNVLFFYCTNPLFSVPQGEQFAAALDRVSLVVDFSPYMSDSASQADLILPDHTFLERYQDDFIEGLGYPGLGLRQPVVEPLYNTRHTADVLLQIAHEVGGPVAEAFPWRDFVALLQFRLSKLDVSWDELVESGVWSRPPYVFASPGSEEWHEVVGRDRQNGHQDGKFDFFSRELRCTVRNRGLAENPDLQALGVQAQGDVVYLPHYEAPKYQGEEKEYPFVLNTYKLMSQVFGRGANLPTLQEAIGMHIVMKWDSWVEINPAAARELGIEDRDEVWVESPRGRVKTRARLYEGVRPEVVNIPFGQGHRALGRWARNRGVNANEILVPGTEPLAGLASFSATRVRIYKA